MGGENKLTFWQRVKGAFGPIDLTKGGITKGIILFALPIILSYLFQQIYTISDAAICGQTLSSGRVAGINDSTSLIYIFLQFAFGSTAGFCVITSLRIGAGQGMGKSAFCRALLPPEPQLPSLLDLRIEQTIQRLKPV